MKQNLLKGKFAVAATAAGLMLGGMSVANAEVKMGVVMGVTGPIPDLVAAMVGGMQLAVNHVNDQGGMRGGQTLLAPLTDGQCNPQVAVDAADKLVNIEQIDIMVGETCSGATIAVAENITVPAGIVQISPSATAPSITGLDDNDMLFRGSASDAFQGVALAKLVMDQGFEKIALTFANDDYNVGIADVFRTAYTDLGGEIVNEAMHEPEKSSYRSELASLTSGGPEALVLFAYYNQSGNIIIRQSLENGLFDNFIGADGMAAQAMVDELGAANLQGRAWFTAPADDVESDSFQMFADLMAASGNGIDPSAPYVSKSYDVTFLAALALEAAGEGSEVKPAHMRAVASAPGVVVRPGEWEKAVQLLSQGQDINYEGASGPLDFDENGDVTGLYSVNVAGDDGKLTVIDLVQ